MEGKIRELGSVNLRRIDIRDWDSPVAQQHGINSIPRLMLYAGDELLSEDTREVLGMLHPR